MMTRASWLLDSDPALRWQVERDLVREPPEAWGATRVKVATEGFGARLPALQDPDGQWAGGAYFPAGFDFPRPRSGRGRRAAVDGDDVDVELCSAACPRASR